MALAILTSFIILVEVMTLGTVENFDYCKKFASCNECILQSDCVWCADPDFLDQTGTKGLSGCRSRNSYGNCANIMDPSSSVTPVLNASLQVSGISPFVQIWPQQLRIEARLNDTISVDFAVAHKKQFPLDIYLLIDKSISEEFFNLATFIRLRDYLDESNSDYRMGLGYFFRESKPLNESNCYEKCQFGFRNAMSLSKNISEVRRLIEKSFIVGKSDSLQNGLEALVQVMSCTEIVKWREKSMKNVIFITDQNSHVAGDGKLAGILAPNDGQCHLNSQTGVYELSSKQDFPSIGQIDFLARKKDINIVWAVTKDKLDVYSNLADFVENSLTARLSIDFDEILHLLKIQYESITTTIAIEALNNNEELETNIFTKDERCLLNSNECHNIVLGSPVQFRQIIKLKKCFEGTKILEVSAKGIEDGLKIDLKAICTCNCNDSSENEGDCGSEECSSRGKLVCGKCECCANFFGRKCECEMGDVIEPENACRANNDNNVCSNRGRCVCGKCVCAQPTKDVRVSGQFCEKVCDNTSCPRDEQNRLCSGSGLCVCGQCECDAGYEGESCECRSNLTLCTENNEICSNKGVCLCNKCLCTVPGYTGEFCENCESCDSYCQNLKDCAECQIRFAQKYGKLGLNTEITVGIHVDPLQNCLNKCKNVGDIEDWSTDDNRLWSLPNCSFELDNCRYTFSHFADNSQETHLVLHTLNDNQFLQCPPPPDLLGFALFLTFSVLILGLFTLAIWKVLVILQDRRECAEFEDQCRDERFDAQANPLFKRATTTVLNPTFVSSQVQAK